ncbi:4'-phosphopantetheinyl transferase family protein [Longibacter sp.]|jgi:4'-phosphopantetheinyl transferase|uniref:4'-phosphopantetheinyl transferase family protein n=1 Tax=Longibacter sp. TaxID=2045415 RepID=UPI003EBB2DE8
MTGTPANHRDSMPQVWERAARRLKTMVSGSGGSDLHLHAVTYGDEHVQRWRSWLSGSEGKKAGSFGSKKRSREFLAGRAAARELLAHATGGRPEDVGLKVAPDDAVDVVGSNWHLSIAHCGPHAVAGISRDRIGLDLEEIAPRNPDVKRFLSHPDDGKVLQRLPFDARATLILVWSIKEAVLKARRSGFRTSPKKLRLMEMGVTEAGASAGEASGSTVPATGVTDVSVEGGDSWRVAFTRVRPEMLDRKAAYWWTVAVPVDPEPSG